ncbi:MAG: hypothetical protein CM1200mP2_25350 [Planctomycetaceae bacterium]|nr:MAG: hypothetical protein CM1200mP2_25350 [Planctomycetaceae bacterium]
MQIADRPDDRPRPSRRGCQNFPDPTSRRVTIGIADETLVPTMARQMADCQVPPRVGSRGGPARHTSLGLLEAVPVPGELHLDEAGDDPVTTVAYGPLAALWRHPDFETG